MSLDFERLFISKLIEDPNFAEAQGIQAEYFDDPKYREAFVYIRNYYAEFAQIPSRRVFRADQPDINLAEVPESWAVLRDRLTNQYRRGKMTELLDPFRDAYDSGNTEEALRILSSTVSQMHQTNTKSRDVDVTQNGDERLARYQERRDNPGTLVGVPTGFPTIDKATQGLQPGQLVTFTGLAKASKSTLAMLCAMAVQEYGKKVLYLTYEQTVEEQERRLDAYRAGINDNLLNSGEINNADWARLQEGMHRTENLSTMVISEDCMTVSAIAAKIDAHEPDIVIIDGVYMVEDENGADKGSPQALANIVSGLKFLAMNRMLCIVAVTQSTPARTKGETLNNDSIMGSRAFIQYSNTVIGIERTDDSTIRMLKILLSRSCAPIEVPLRFNYDTGEFNELDFADIEYTEQGDDEDDDGEGMGRFSYPG